MLADPRVVASLPGEKLENIWKMFMKIMVARNLSSLTTGSNMPYGTKKPASGS
jgi:hypothetical protein